MALRQLGACSCTGSGSDPRQLMDTPLEPRLVSTSFLVSAVPELVCPPAHHIQERQEEGRAMEAPVVDIHCHTFNADDLPVRGFVQRVAMHDLGLGALLAELIDLVIQGATPGYQAEKARLDAILGSEEQEAVLEVAAGPSPSKDLETELEAEVDQAVRDIQQRNPTLLPRVGAELAAEEGLVPEEAVMEGFLDWPSAARRAVRWVKLFGKSRLDLSGHLVAAFRDRVDLFCAMLVDLGKGLGDEPPTSLRQQVELQEKISRLTMQGRMPGGGRARIHPFMGFDPRRQLQAVLAKDVETPFDVLMAAVERYGFIGVKLYPPMGWRPIGNRSGVDMASREAEMLDDILRELYTWCQGEQVPITSHCNESNYAHVSYRDYAAPDNWIAVLEQFPELHLNLGHFGGARREEKPDGWPWKIARAAKEFEHLYVDVGNHRVYDEDLMNEYLTMLGEMFASPETAVMRERIMFGSDWFMVALHKDHERFLETYEQEFKARFGAEPTSDFLGGTARRFLGFDEPNNRNAKRLHARYEQFAPDRVPSWLAEASNGRARMRG
jgi:predicted TIM-barrel fold metal-dependent hydrolase